MEQRTRQFRVAKIKITIWSNILNLILAVSINSLLCLYFVKWVSNFCLVILVSFPKKTSVMFTFTHINDQTGDQTSAICNGYIVTP